MEDAILVGFGHPKLRYPDLACLARGKFKPHTWDYYPKL